MAAWTTAQDETLRELCFMGAGAVRDEIERRHGVAHTAHAVEARASRLRVSLAVRPVCPECGAVGVRLNRQTGMCAGCTLAMRVEEERVFNELLRAERDQAENPARLAEMQREYDRLRQENSRMCRKYGLRGKRGRGL